jgi:filamentous hemagglutinin family protein
MRMKPSFFLDRLRRATALVSAASLFVTQTSAHALPQGGTVAAGQAAISQSGSALDVHQSSSRTVLNWQSFDVGNGESVNFHQPSQSAIALNRINGGNVSQILGNLNANGQVWLVNPSGVVFGEHAQVNVGGLVATTSNIDNARFMSGSYVFDQVGDAFGSIVNQGRIKVADGGLAALVGANVSNDGRIEAQLGRIQLASGDRFALDLFGDGLINLQAGEALTHQAVSNSGRLDAAGGQVRLSLAAAQATLSSLINLGGFVGAQDIILGGDTVMLTGSLHATDSVAIGGRSVAQQGSIATEGGRIVVTASEVYLDSEASRTTANGASGGSIHIDGG